MYYALDDMHHGFSASVPRIHLVCASKQCVLFARQKRINIDLWWHWDA